MKKNISLVAIVVIIVSYGIVKILTSSPANHEKHKLFIGTFAKSMGNVPFYVAKENGWLEKAVGDSFKVEYYEYNDRSSIASALSSGNLIFFFSAEVPAILIQAQGEPIEFAALSATLTQEVIVQSKSKMNAISDLRGKKIAVTIGTSSHYALLKVLSDNGLSTKDVDIKFMPVSEGKTAFEKGDIDAWAVWPPWVEEQQLTGFAKSLKGSNAVIHSVGSMPKSFIQSYPALADSLSDIIRRAKYWIKNNREEAQNITAKQLGFNIEVVKLAWPKFNWSAIYDSSVLDDMQKKAIFLSEQKLTRNNTVININNELIGKNIKK